MEGNGNAYKTSLINNRRYLGSKYRLLPFITEVVASRCQGIGSVADIFSGTGAVASAFSDKILITNDLLYSNYVCNYAWFGAEEYDAGKIADHVVRYNSISRFEENYMTRNFAGTYFSWEDCSKIGIVREDIQSERQEGRLNMREYCLLVTSLMYAMDRIANTCGHYDAYRLNGDFGSRLALTVPLASHLNNRENRCYNEDANNLVRRISADLVYIDPPYNSRQYSDAYHLLENVARWEQPEVYGKARKLDRSSIKSRYCTKEASSALEDLVSNINARYILVSYNNMASKGNDRSNAKIADGQILGALSKKGRVEVFSASHKAFSTGKSDIKDNAERLFLCVCA